MGKPGNTGLRRILLATGYSAQGFRQAWRNEAAFRQELTLAIVLLPVALWLGQSPMEWLILIVPLLLVLIVELLNSSIEATVDRIGSDHHELAGRAKDMGSAAVFVSLVIVLLVWATVAWQRFLV
jgi:diacylglycerol kinase (ATP)